MKKTNIFIGLILVFILYGCTTTLGKPSYTEVADSIATIQPGKARIYVYRQSGFVGGGLKPHVSINGHVYFKTIAGAFSFVDVDPGKYRVTTSRSQGNHVLLDLSAGDMQYITFEMVWGGVFFPRKQPAGVAEREIQQLVYISSDKNANIATNEEDIDSKGTAVIKSAAPGGLSSSGLRFTRVNDKKLVATSTRLLSLGYLAPKELKLPQGVYKLEANYTDGNLSGRLVTWVNVLENQVYLAIPERISGNLYRLSVINEQTLDSAVVSPPDLSETQ